MLFGSDCSDELDASEGSDCQPDGGKFNNETTILYKHIF